LPALPKHYLSPRVQVPSTERFPVKMNICLSWPGIAYRLTLPYRALEFAEWIAGFRYRRRARYAGPALLVTSLLWLPGEHQ